jgi:ABC-type uncharacterized transport system substrate-binding protein
MRRRDVIFSICCLAITPVATFAQQAERTRRIAILMNRAANDPEGQARLATFKQAMERLGWSEGRNIRIDVRYGEDNIDLARKYAAELVALSPDLILAGGTVSTTALQALTRSLPIVFAVVTDPVGAGFVKSLARPGGNVTGFSLYEYSLSGKWVEILKQIAPSVTRVAVLRGSTNPAGLAFFGAISATAQSLGVEVIPIGMQTADEIEKEITEFSHTANGALIVTPNSAVSMHRALIIDLAARYKLPAVYPYSMATAGGLVSYGPDSVELFGSAATYVDRVLKGEKPSDLPVQQPTRYKMIVNLKTAKALGLDVSQTLIGRADEVIE